MSTVSRLKLLVGRTEITCIAFAYAIYFVCAGTFANNIAELIPDPVLRAFRNPLYIHFILMPAYLFLLHRHDLYVAHVLCKIRMRSAFQLYAVRLRDVIIETSVFVIPLLVFFAIPVFTSALTTTTAAICFLNVFLHFLMVGAVCCALSMKLNSSIYLIVFSLLTVDSLASIGTLPTELSVYYLHMASVFAKADDSLRAGIVLSSAAKLAVLTVLGTLFHHAKRTRYVSKIAVIARLWRQHVAAAALSATLVAFACMMRFGSVEKTVIAVLGGMYTAEIPSVIVVALYNATIISHLFLFGSVISKDLDRSAVFLFSRSYSRKRWLARKSGEAVLRSILFSAVLTLGVVIGSMAAGIGVHSWSQLAKLLLQVCMSVWMCNAAFVLLANILGLRLKPFLAVAAAWIIYMPGQLLLSLSHFPETLAKLMPSSQSVLALHSLPSGLTDIWDSFFDHALRGFTPLFSFGYSATLIAALLVAGLLCLRRRDIHLDN